MTTTQTFDVLGLTCAHCAHAVTEELQAIDGVSTVHVELAPGGTSVVQVQADRTLTPGDVRAALDEAGDYRLAP